MNKLNRKVEYALMALKHMCEKRPTELTTAKEVVEDTGCPFDATARVMQLMAQKGVLKSSHGSQGGYNIVRDLSKLSLHELIEIILGPLSIVKCVHSMEECDLQNTCNVKSPLAELNIRLIAFYKNLTVAEILKIKVKDHKDKKVEREKEKKRKINGLLHSVSAVSQRR